MPSNKRTRALGRLASARTVPSRRRALTDSFPYSKRLVSARDAQGSALDEQPRPGFSERSGLTQGVASLSATGLEA